MQKLKRALLDFRSNAPSIAATKEQFVIDGVAIDYTLKRSTRRRSITLTVDAHGLRVGAPWRASQSRIESLLVRHANWIARKLGDWNARRPAAFVWAAGATVMALGEPLVITADRTVDHTIRSGDRLYVGGDDDAALLEK